MIWRVVTEYRQWRHRPTQGSCECYFARPSSLVISYCGIWRGRRELKTAAFATTINVPRLASGDDLVSPSADLSDRFRSDENLNCGDVISRRCRACVERRL